MKNSKPIEFRLRKAWEVSVRGYDQPVFYFAATAGKARIEAWRDLSDCSELRIVDVVARRASYRDVKLPIRDPIADLLSAKESHCLLHAFGGNDNPIKAGYRDYFYTQRDDPTLVALTERGLMEPMAGDQWGENMTYFVMTKEGKRVALSMIPEYAR